MAKSGADQTTEWRKRGIMRLKGKVAVITGAASGIGKATVERFTEEGALVIIGDIQRELGEELSSEIGDNAAFKYCDMTEENDVKELMELAVTTFGRLDIVMNNAGIVGSRGPISSTDASEFKATLDILLYGTFLGIKHAAPYMEKQKSGSIINIASTAGVTGGLGPHVYAAAKHGVVGLTKNVAAELCRSGVRVNCIAPGSTVTPLVAAAYTDDHEAIEEVSEIVKAKSPILDRPGMPLDVANAALYLASDESGNTNGHCLVVDGGLTTGSTPNDPPHSDSMPFLREAGQRGL